MSVFPSKFEALGLKHSSQAGSFCFSRSLLSPRSATGKVVPDSNPAKQQEAIESIDFNRDPALNPKPLNRLLNPKPKTAKVLQVMGLAGAENSFLLRGMVVGVTVVEVAFLK